MSNTIAKLEEARERIKQRLLDGGQYGMSEYGKAFNRGISVSIEILDAMIAEDHNEAGKADDPIDLSRLTLMLSASINQQLGRPLGYRIFENAARGLIKTAEVKRLLEKAKEE